MLQTISKFNLSLTALVLLSGVTFNSLKVDATISQDINLTQLPAANLIAAAPEWQQFSPDKGNFSILMPNTEIVDMAPEPGELDEGVKAFKMYMSVHEKDVFMVSYADFKSDVSHLHSSELLDSAVEGMLESGKKLVSQKNINLGAYSGREVQFWDETAGMTLTGRVFIVKQRMYMLLVGSEKNPQISDVSKFLNSFQLID